MVNTEQKLDDTRLNLSIEAFEICHVKKTSKNLLDKRDPRPIKRHRSVPIHLDNRSSRRHDTKDEKEKHHTRDTYHGGLNTSS